MIQLCWAKPKAKPNPKPPRDPLGTPCRGGRISTPRGVKVAILRYLGVNYLKITNFLHFEGKLLKTTMNPHNPLKYAGNHVFLPQGRIPPAPGARTSVIL